MKSALAEGMHLFNTQKFFEAHEALEALWLEAHGEEKLFLHGLIQVAAAFHQWARGNVKGFRQLLEKGLMKLEKIREAREGIDVIGLRQQLEPWRDFLEVTEALNQLPLPPLPQILPTKIESATEMQ